MKINITKSFEYMLVILATSIFLPPYSIKPLTGEILTANTILGTASVDYFFATMGHQYFHLSGILISIWTFLVVPILLLIIASKLSKSSFVSSV